MSDEHTTPGREDVREAPSVSPLGVDDDNIDVAPRTTLSGPRTAAPDA